MTPPVSQPSQHNSPANGMPHQAPGRVLIVDDVAANVRLLMGILKVEGFQVEGASGGAEALQKLHSCDGASDGTQGAPDVVLLDVMMPGMDGFELCRRIRAEPSTSRLPVVLVTALNETRDRVAGIEAGADDFLSKPVDELEVVARVRSLVRAKRDRDALEAAHRDLQHAEQARESMTAMLVHDLRTPLTTMLASLDLLLPAPDSGKPDSGKGAATSSSGNSIAAGGMGAMQGELLRLCARSGRHLLTLVNQLLDIARLEDGEMPLRIEEVEAAEVVDEAVAQVSARSRSSYGSAETPIEVSIEPGSALLHADPDLLRRVLINLLGNAVKFTRSNTSVRVHVALSEPKESPQDSPPREQPSQIVFSVSDQGPGVDEADRERIFDKFAQANDRHHNRRPSSGLGLFFCRLAVEAHGGRIWVESSHGAGSTFRFSLPQSAPSTS